MQEQDIIKMKSSTSNLISRNPADNSIVGEVRISSKEEILEKVKHAHVAKREWKMLGAKKRSEILLPLIDMFKQKKDELISLTIKEMGKTRTEAEADFAGDFDYFIEFLKHGPTYIEDEITVNDGKAQHRIVYEPQGVVACIVPWNFPFTNFIWSVIPNLIVGNTVIFKHSEECPLVEKLCEEVMAMLPDLPHGVFSAIYGASQEGMTLAESEIDMIWFTGSSLTGRKLYNVAGRKQIKAILEMGGSNPSIIFDDVDIDLIIPNIYRGRFTNCGQVCDAVKRLIVHESIFEKIVNKLCAYVQEIKMGDPNKLDTQLGPLAAMRQLQLLEAQVADAVELGATIVAGGKRPDGFTGAYYLPTIIVDVNTRMRIWQEEVFGPVLPIVSFKTEAEAIALANDTVYGLGSAVHSNDLARARRVAAQIDAGFVDINEGSHWRQCNPFGGYKQSGMGCEHGRLGFQALCQFKVIAEG